MNYDLAVALFFVGLILWTLSPFLMVYGIRRGGRRRGTRYRLRVSYYATPRSKRWGFAVVPVVEEDGRTLAPVATGRRRTRATATMAARWKARRHARAKRLEARSWEWEVRR